jgi:hypothetical protein
MIQNLQQADELKEFVPETCIFKLAILPATIVGFWQA